MDEKEKFERIKSTFEEYIKQETENLKKIKENFNIAKENNNEYKVQYYSKMMQKSIDRIELKEITLANMRLINEDDINERTRIRDVYASEIKLVIPDDEPVVFHGNNNIGVVKRIIASGGLFTPEERDSDYTSYAGQIDVGAKNNINTVLEFAEPNARSTSFLPYGAIFVFYPYEDEYDKVLKTGDNSEVDNGVKSIKFNEDRFIGIITTEENIEVLKKCMLENGYDDSKVFTHQEFLNYCKKIFPNKNNVYL